MKQRILRIVLGGLVLVPLAACSSEKKAVGPTVEIDDTTPAASGTDAPVTQPAVAPTERAGATEAVTGVTRLADDSPTCDAIRKVKELNDKAGELTAGLGAALSSGEAASDPAALQKAFDDYITSFTDESATLVPELNGAYDTLAKEQPQFAADLANLKDVTGPLIEKIGELKGKNLAEVDLNAFLTEAVPEDKITEAGAASLKIDAFSKAACELPFANT